MSASSMTGLAVGLTAASGISVSMAYSGTDVNSGTGAGGTSMTVGTSATGSFSVAGSAVTSLAGAGRAGTRNSVGAAVDDDSVQSRPLSRLPITRRGDVKLRFC